MRAFAILALASIPLSGAELRVGKAGEAGRVVENAYYIADLAPESGTLRALTLKQFGVTLRRDPANGLMHKGVSIQREGAPSYKDLGAWTTDRTIREDRTPGAYVLRREGRLPDYPEVRVEVEYRFPADAPYFVVGETMTVEKPIRVVLLRNNEMTMDLFFTHLAWPGREGQARLTTFDERYPFVEKEPLPADVPWVGFMNLEKGYGYGFVAMENQASRAAKADTTIADGFNTRGGGRVLSGRYWSRHLVMGPPAMELTPGDRFHSTTAYVVFRCSKERPYAELLDWRRKLAH